MASHAFRPTFFPRPPSLTKSRPQPGPGPCATPPCPGSTCPAQRPSAWGRWAQRWAQTAGRRRRNRQSEARKGRATNQVDEQPSAPMCSGAHVHDQSSWGGAAALQILRSPAQRRRAACRAQRHLRAGTRRMGQRVLQRRSRGWGHCGATSELGAVKPHTLTAVGAAANAAGLGRLPNSAQDLHGSRGGAQKRVDRAIGRPEMMLPCCDRRSPAGRARCRASGAGMMQHAAALAQEQFKRRLRQLGHSRS